jgi:predicted MFS family arabinose efflux permease
VSVIGNILSRVGFGGVPFILPLLLQISLGYSPSTSGFLLAPTALGVFIMKPFSVFFLRLMGYKKLLVFNTFLVAYMLWIFSHVNHDTSRYVIALMTFIYGFLIAMQFSGMNSLAYAKITPDDLSAATSIMSTVQQLSQSFGVAVAALFIRFFIPYFSTSNTLVLQAFQLTFIAMSFMTFLSLLIFLRLKPHDGRELLED